MKTIDLRADQDFALRLVHRQEKHYGFLYKKNAGKDYDQYKFSDFAKFEKIENQFSSLKMGLDFQFFKF